MSEKLFATQVELESSSVQLISLASPITDGHLMQTFCYFPGDKLYYTVNGMIFREPD